MGQKDGFMQYQRKVTALVDPMERTKGFEEFHIQLSDSERKQQAARCMNCGVPFCQSGMKLNGMFTGCPLHNMIPEWNDMLYLGNTRHALSRLLKNNPFPEFTGRVCPALCEAACMCGMNGESVTVHENEYYIIEEAYKNGWMQPNPPTTRTDKKVAVIGSGPSGLACAYTLNRRGHNVTVFEKNDKPGGLMMYGIPNMKLDKKVISRRVEMMKAEGVEFVTNADVGNSVSAEEIMNSYDAVVLCCGAGQPRDLNIPGRDANGVYFAVDYLTAATKYVVDGLDPISAKDKHVVIVGGGDTGNDCVGTSIRLGCKSVTQLEMLPQPPVTRAENNPWPEWPKVLKTDYGQQEAIAHFGHDPRIFETTVQEIIKDEAGSVKALRIVNLKGRDAVPGTEREIPCDLMLIAAGFVGCRRYIPEAFGVDVDQRGAVITEDYATKVPGIFSAGDMRRGQSLVVWGITEGKNAARKVDEYLMGYSAL